LKKTRVEYEPHLNQPHSIRFRKILRSAQIHEEIEGLEREKERKLAKTSAEPYLKWKREKKREDKLRQRSSSGYLGEPGSNQRSRGGDLSVAVAEDIEVELKPVINRGSLYTEDDPFTQTL
tara:strand:- start:782 stop:1144 length:363 start_codon:yes stop_codon:yes gene_type:complete